MKPHYICVDCGNYFTVNKKQTDIDSLVIPAPEHKYGDSWEYKGSDGHGKVCTCGAIESIIPHVPGDEATDTTPQLCQECGYVIKTAKNHIHKLSLVPGKKPTCTEKGRIDYYTCTCGKWFEDEQAQKEITLPSSIMIMPGHSFGPPVLETPATHNSDGTVTPGMKAHYACAECDKLFNLNKQEKTAEKLTITEAEHRFYDENSDGKCDDCEKILEALAAEQEQTNKPTENDPQTNSQNEEKEDGGTPWWLILLLALLATGGGVLGALLLIKKKKDGSEKTEDEKKENAE